VRRVLEDYFRLDERIQHTRLSANRGISGASNAALALANGKFVAMLEHDDELQPEALFEVVKLLNEQPDLDIIYTDEDKKTRDGRRISPFFKPDWSPNLLLSCNYIAHLLVHRRSLLDEAGGFRSAFDVSQDYDLALRASEKTARIAHIAKPLYSWRMISGSAAASESAKPYAYKAAARALKEALERRQMPGSVENTDAPGIYHARPKLKREAFVSVIIPTRDKSGLLEPIVRVQHQDPQRRSLYRRADIQRRNAYAARSRLRRIRPQVPGLQKRYFRAARTFLSCSNLLQDGRRTRL